MAKRAGSLALRRSSANAASSSGRIATDPVRGGAANASASRPKRLHAPGLHLHPGDTPYISPLAEGEKPLVDTVAALRHAGCSWIDILRHRVVQREVSTSFASGWEQGSGLMSSVFPSPAQWTRHAYSAVRAKIPTFALRHAGGSWTDVVTHPAFRVAPTKIWPSVPTAHQPPCSNLKSAMIGPGLPFSPTEALRHAGCSWSDIALHAAVQANMRARLWAGAVRVYVNTFVRHPFTTALTTSIAKCVVSDLIVQKFVEGKEQIDRGRVLSFFLLGVTYVGAFQYSLYNHLLKPLNDVMRPAYGVGASTFALVAVDQFFVGPFVYFPSFCGLKLWATGESAIVDVPAKVKAMWKEGVFGTIAALWAVWIPAQAINFWLVPRHLTIPFMNVVGFGWNFILSAMHGSRMGSDAAADGEPGSGAVALVGVGAAPAGPERVGAATEAEARVDVRTVIEAVARDVQEVATVSSSTLAAATETMLPLPPAITAASPLAKGGNGGSGEERSM